MTQDDWKAWIANPVTKEFFRGAESEAMQPGSAYNPKSVDETALNCAYNTGFDNGLECALTWEPNFEGAEE